MPVSSCPGMVGVTPSVSNLAGVQTLLECSTCPGSITAASPTVCAGESVVLEAELNDTGAGIATVNWSIEGIGDFDGQVIEITPDEAGDFTYFLSISTQDGCEYGFNGSITVLPTPEIPDIPNVINVCGDTSALLDLSGFVDLFQISVNGVQLGQNPVYSFPGEGVYTVFFTSPCASYSIQVTVYDGLAIDLPPAACIDQEVSINFLNWAILPENANLLINYGNGTQEPVDNTTMSTSYSQPGIYTISVSGFLDDCEVFTSAEILIESGPPDFDLNPEAQFCEGEVFTLDFGGLAFSVVDAQDDTLSVFETELAGVYTFTALGACENVMQEVAISMIAFDPQPFDLYQELCPERDTLELGFSDDAYIFQWTSGANTAIIDVLEAGEYNVLVSDSSGFCMEEFSFVVFNTTPTPADIFPDDYLELCEEGSRLIRPDSIDFPFFFPDSSVGYSYQVNESGPLIISYSDACYTYDYEIFVELIPCLCPLVVPNVITPNGDGRNDVFLPLVECPIEEYNIEIYNRWGQLVFESDDLLNPWDGRHRQSTNDCPDGQYFYIIQYAQSLDGVRVPGELNGHLTILRSRF